MPKEGNVRCVICVLIVCFLFYFGNVFLASFQIPCPVKFPSCVTTHPSLMYYTWVSLSSLPTVFYSCCALLPDSLRESSSCSLCYLCEFSNLFSVFQPSYGPALFDTFACVINHLRIEFSLIELNLFFASKTHL